MNHFETDDPDLEEAVRELDEEFPEVIPDESLSSYLRKREFKKQIFSVIKKRIKMIIINLFFYSLFTFLIYIFFKKYGAPIKDCMVYGMSYFLIYILAKYRRKLK